MNRTRPRRAAALLLAATLGLAAVPAAAAPAEPGGGEARSATGLFDTLTAWFRALLPDAGPGRVLSALRATVVGGDGAATEPQLAGAGGPAGDPTADPESGVILDPAG